MIGICPCKDCEKRHPLCHSKCKEYLQWAEAKAQAREAERLYNRLKYVDYRKNRRKRK